MNYELTKAIGESDLGSTEKLVAVALAAHADEAGESYPSVGRLSRWTSLHEATVKRALAKLEAGGWVRRRAQLDAKGRNRANRYRLQVPELGAQSAPLAHSAPLAPAQTPEKGRGAERASSAQCAPGGAQSAPQEGRTVRPRSTQLEVLSGKKTTRASARANVPPGVSVWPAAVELAAEQVNEHVLRTYFEPLAVIAETPARLELGAPNKFMRDWLEDNMRERITECIARAAGRDVELVLSVTPATLRAPTREAARMRRERRPW